MTITPEPIAAIDEFREAASAVVTSSSRTGEGLRALVMLMERARQEPDPWTRRTAERAIWMEVRPWLAGLVDPEANATPADANPWRAAQRRLRAHGLAQCPECLRPVATESDLRRDAVYESMGRTDDLA